MGLYIIISSTKHIHVLVCPEKLHLYENVIGSAVPHVSVNTVSGVIFPSAKEWLNSMP
jgi:hypothetical protein